MNRRDFIRTSTAGLAAATIPAADSGRAQDNLVREAQLGTLRSASPADLQGLVGDGRQRRILLRGGVVLSLDPSVGDFEKADVLIDGKRIAEVAPTVSASDAEIVDCSGTIVMPGFISTHHHQYETLQRSLIPDGLLAGGWPQESYGSVVQNIWTAGRIADAANPTNFIWDLGRVPYDPEDLYISELVACLSEISEGITMGTDTSQASHTPEHTDAMIQGLVDSGRRMVYDYSPGIDRSADGIPYEFPGAVGDTTKGIGRIAKKYFSSRDQLVTLGCGAGPTEAFPGAGYTGWQLGRAFGALINNHNVGGSNVVLTAAADARNLADWSDVTSIHCTRWQDDSRAQIGDVGAGYTNMTTDPFSLMRGAFCLQRALANDLAFSISNPGSLPVPQLLTSRQVIEMITI